MKNDEILSLISEFCRQADMAELTFGRRVVNDGKRLPLVAVTTSARTRVSICCTSRPGADVFRQRRRERTVGALAVERDLAGRGRERDQRAGARGAPAPSEPGEARPEIVIERPEPAAATFSTDCCGRHRDQDVGADLVVEAGQDVSMSVMPSVRLRPRCRAEYRSGRESCGRRSARRGRHSKQRDLGARGAAMKSRVTLSSVSRSRSMLSVTSKPRSRRVLATACASFGGLGKAVTWA